MKHLLIITLFATQIVMAQVPGLHSNAGVDSYVRSRVDSILDGTLAIGSVPYRLKAVDGSPDSAVFVNGSGYFGINNNNPIFRLDVGGDINGNTFKSYTSSLLSAGNGWATIYTAGNKLTIDKVGGGQTFVTIDGVSGVFGIGKVALHLLDVAGTIRADSAISSPPYSAALTDAAPTNTEIAALVGAANTHEDGFAVWLKDTDGTALTYRAVAIGGVWWTDPLTAAP